MNTLLCTDVYKMGHMMQYPEDTAEVYSYLEARKPGHDVVFFGLQYILKEYLCKPITYEDGAEFLKYYEQILGKVPDIIVHKIFDLCTLGYWPLEIKAVAEGSVVGSQNVLLTIRNTIPGMYWCVGFVESLLLKLWNPCTVATMSREYYKLCKKFSDLTCDNDNHLMFQVHDFGYRGVSSEETAMISGASHLLNFYGSDTVPANYFLDKYYNGLGTTKGLSVPASEHSVMCSYGKEDEFKAFDRMLELYPTGIVSIVSDSYDYFRVITEWAKTRKDKIMARDGKVVFRPDSGDPMKILCGHLADVLYPSAGGTAYETLKEGEGDPTKFYKKGYEVPDNLSERDLAEINGTFETLWNIFGGTINSKGYRVLDPHVGVIYGDGMYYERFEKILNKMEHTDLASSNLVIGVGGVLLQRHDRDEFGFAIKATRIVKKDGTKVEIFKDPATDKSKKSKKGLMKLCRDDDTLIFNTVDCLQELESNQELVGNFRVIDKKIDHLLLVFKDGNRLIETSLDHIRQELKEYNEKPSTKVTV